MADTIEETKVYYPEEIPDIELPELVNYAQVIDAPQSVSDLNTVDGQKLEGIEYNAGDPYWINDVINARIDTAQKNILADWNFGDTDYAGGVYAGDISWNSVTGAVTGGSGVVINRAGIIGANSGSTTFAIDATTGDATFSGDITASTITGGTITGTTITGGTIRTSSSGARVQMLDSTNTLQILDSSGNVRAESYSNGWEFNTAAEVTAGRIFIEGTFNNLQIQAVTSDLFLTSIDDITFAPGNGSISMYIDGSTKDLVLNSGDLVLGSTTIAGGGSWTLTLPSTNGSSGEFLQTDGAGNTTWASVTGGANTSLSNLTTTSVNQHLIPGSSTLDLGTSAAPWDRGYIDDVYLTNGDGGIYYNANLALDFYATRIELGSLYDELSPSSTLQANLGASTNRWNAFFVDDIDANAADITNLDANDLDMFGNIDMNSNSILDCDDIEFDTDEYIDADGGSDLRIYAGSDTEFYIGGVIKAIVDNNFWTDGDLQANGSKPFIIPHPDGSDRLLRYTAQESPEVLLRHRGEATTDGSGRVTIFFPDHFRLVTDAKGKVTVNLTPVGDYHVYLDGAPDNGMMAVATSEPKVTFHYEVIAVRDGFLGRSVEIEAGDDEGLHAKMAGKAEKEKAAQATLAARKERRTARLAYRAEKQAAKEAKANEPAPVRETKKRKVRKKLSTKESK